MVASQDRLPVPSHDPLEVQARQFGNLKQRIERGDPIAIYEAILMCSDAKVQLPLWLSNHLLKVIADYHLGNKPSWKGVGNRPIIILRRRLEADIKRRAVAAVRSWQKDKSRYQGMATRCIKMWFDGEVKHQDCTTLEDALDLASEGLSGLRVQAEGPTIKCSARTLRRAYAEKGSADMPEVPRPIAAIFGLKAPDSFFGSDLTLPDDLK